MPVWMQEVPKAYIYINDMDFTSKPQREAWLLRSLCSQMLVQRSSHSCLYKLSNVTQANIIEQYLPYSTYNCCVSLQTTQANSTAVCQQQRTPEDGKYDMQLATLITIDTQLLFLAPESPPIITSIDNSSPYSVVVHWSPPVTPNGVITRYNFYVGYETQSGEIDIFTTGGQSTSYNISNLLPYQRISIEVTASTRIGEGPSSVHNTRTAQARMLDELQLATCHCSNIIANYIFCLFSSPGSEPNCGWWYFWQQHSSTVGTSSSG